MAAPIEPRPDDELLHGPDPYEPEHAPAPPVDRVDADRMAARWERVAAEIAATDQVHAARRADLDAWRDQRMTTLLARQEWYAEALRSFAERELEGRRERTVSLPTADLALRSAQPKVEVRSPVEVAESVPPEWVVDETDESPAPVRMVRKVSVSELKKRTRWVRDDGEQDDRKWRPGDRLVAVDRESGAVVAGVEAVVQADHFHVTPHQREGR